MHSGRPVNGSVQDRRTTALVLQLFYRQRGRVHLRNMTASLISTAEQIAKVCYGEKC